MNTNFYRASSLSLLIVVVACCSFAVGAALDCDVDRSAGGASVLGALSLALMYVLTIESVGDVVGKLFSKLAPRIVLDDLLRRFRILVCQTPCRHGGRCPLPS